MSRLLKSITTSDQRVIATTTKILADNAKCDDFEFAADFLLLAAPQKQCDENEQQRISTIYQGQLQDKGKRKGKVQVGDTGVEFRYYKRTEFKQLKQEQKEDLRQRQVSTKHQEKDGGTSNQQRISAMEAILE